MLESIELSTAIAAPARRIYEAWLSSEEHSAFTGGEAVVDPTVGGKHAVWGDYIISASWCQIPCP